MRNNDLFLLTLLLYLFNRNRDRDVDAEDEEDVYERKKLERRLREKEAAYQEVCILLSWHRHGQMNCKPISGHFTS
jgi:uncharacterized membrane protein